MRVIDLPAVLAGLGFIALGLGGLFLAGRDSKADEHDLSDYQPEPQPVNDAPRSLARVELLDRQRTEYDWSFAADILPPAPEGMNAGSPLYAGMLFDTWFPESAEDTAARFLREIAAEVRGGSNIDPHHGHAVCWDGTCELGCPACADEALAGAR